MRLEYQILTAVLLDLLLGDPQWLPHPVRAIAWLATRLELLARRWCASSLRLAGFVTALTVYTATGAAAWGLIRLASLAHPGAGEVVSILFIYTAIAASDLAKHSRAVFLPLVHGNLPEARRRVAAIVGRDTHNLDAAGVVRAAVESVAESTIDGVTAPLFFAVLFGPIGAIVYRAVNTLDSLFGHRDEAYCEFGWASARIDDLANYLPARLTAPLMCVAAIPLRGRAVQAMWILRRDGRKHESPNSGLTEAAMAGALGVQLGGVNYYDGQPALKPTIGDALTLLSPRHIVAANALMFVTTGLFLTVTLLSRFGAVHCWHAWRAAT